MPTITPYETLPDPILTPIAEEVLKRRYLVRDENGEPAETPKDLFWRVASTIAEEDRRYEWLGCDEKGMNDHIYTLSRKFYQMMAQGYWLPNSPTLMNAGRPLGQLSACFVLPVEDALSNGKDGIYDTLTAMALIHQSGGGTGFSFSRLRPNGSIVRSTTGVASGPVSFMRLYDASTDVVKQGGTRRGANMGVLRVDHPDILGFVDCKRDTSKITNFNISVAVTQEFMERVQAGDEDAVKVWDRICENAWRTGEPGLFFIDEANYWNPVPHMGEYEATNPCGEQPLAPYDVCNLGSLNLSKFVDEDAAWAGDEYDPLKSIDWQRMSYYIDTSVRFLDNVIDANKYPLKEIESVSKRTRRIGNGVMGFADMLIKLRIPYGSEESFKVADAVASFFVAECKAASERLADERGTFQEWATSTHGPDDTCARDKYGERVHLSREQRHCNVTTVAPTGTISMIAGCSGGIEPLYAVAFKRKQADMDVVDVHPDFEHDLKGYLAAAFAQPPIEEKTYDSVLKGVLERGDLNDGRIPDMIKEWYKTSASVAPLDHVRMQSVWQRHICSAISKTINLPNEATVEDVKEAYTLAWKTNCKGVTVYRDGSRPEQVLSTGKTDNERVRDGVMERKDVESVREDSDSAREASRGHGRPEVLNGRTHRVNSPIGGMYVTVNRHPETNKPYEVFVTVGKAGGTTPSFSEAIGRLLSLLLREGIEVGEIHRQLRGISSDRAFGFGNGKIASGPDAVAMVLEKYMDEGQEKLQEDSTEFAACPDCHAELVFEEGCYKCHACGYGGC